MKAEIDVIFLKIVRWLLLFVMSVAILTTIGSTIFAAISYFSAQPKELAITAEPSVAKEKEDFVAELLRQLNEEPPEPSKNESEEFESANLRYTPQATKLIKCFEDFRQQSGAIAFTQDEARNFRDELERGMESYASIADYGDPFVNAMTSFMCDLLLDRRMVRLGREGMLGPIFQPALSYFEAAWDKGVEKKNQAIMQEFSRANSARVRALTSLTVAGSSLSAFVILAFYLMFAKIESNLRMIGEEIRSLKPTSE